MNREPSVIFLIIKLDFLINMGVNHLEYHWKFENITLIIKINNIINVSSLTL